MKFPIAEYDQALAQAIEQLARVRETHAHLVDQRGEQYAMRGLVGALMDTDHSEVVSMLAAAVRES